MPKTNLKKVSPTPQPVQPVRVHQPVRVYNENVIPIDQDVLDLFEVKEKTVEPRLYKDGVRIKNNLPSNKYDNLKENK